MSAEMQNQKMTATEWMTFYEELFRERNRMELSRDKEGEERRMEGEEKKPLPDC